ncbi:hypothetical protein ACFWCA_17340 [Streptomyces phaeochromogenes]|uniref:Uncharacterized protein n=1 Tax=Streptomyces phaeochromogenes TaxID=1923 RepID=A0ABZ1HBT7_STRPH|nr:hypothetical protein [Streptomyces phaeochromogenes]WSD16057.1 hypothetical protein OHB35_23960 [Streptomyces phaeochromogenes]
MSEPKDGRYQQAPSYPWGVAVEIPEPVGITLNTEKPKDYAESATALIPTSEPEKPQRLQDKADIAEARAREASPTGAAMSHEEFMAQLEEEDRREAAS